jgi:hypothetical protein
MQPIAVTKQDVNLQRLSRIAAAFGGFATLG